MSETEIHPDTSLGDLVAEVPRYATVFESFGIDFCCGGDRSLEDACSEEGVPVETVREELRQVPREAASDWDSPSELVDRIVETHHEYLREELPALAALVQKVSRVHGEDHPELHEVAAEFAELKAGMQTHITEEEEDGFPIIEKLDRGESLSPEEEASLRVEIDGFEADHEETAERLHRIADLTDGYEVPEGACGSYRNMLDRLEDLERDTHMHVHRENNVLFPEAEAMLETVR